MMHYLWFFINIHLQRAHSFVICQHREVVAGAMIKNILWKEKLEVRKSSPFIKFVSASWGKKIKLLHLGEHICFMQLILQSSLKTIALFHNKQLYCRRFSQNSRQGFSSESVQFHLHGVCCTCNNKIVCVIISPLSLFFTRL